MKNNLKAAIILTAMGYLIFRTGKKVLTDKDEQIDIMARTAWGEARGEGTQGMQAVINVIMNRVKAGSWYGATPKEVCLKKSQFSCWNTNDPNYKPMLAADETDELFVVAKNLATAAYNGKLADITGGATNYLALGSLTKIPSWASKMTEVASIGNHTFYA